MCVWGGGGGGGAGGYVGHDIQGFGHVSPTPISPITISPTPVSPTLNIQ